jgi:hypothetical protein
VRRREKLQTSSSSFKELGKGLFVGGDFAKPSFVLDNRLQGELSSGLMF